MLPLHSHLFGAAPPKLMAEGSWQVRQSLRVIPFQEPHVSWHNLQIEADVKKNSFGLVQVQAPIGLGDKVILGASLQEVQSETPPAVQVPQVWWHGRHLPAVLSQKRPWLQEQTPESKFILKGSLQEMQLFAP